MSSVVQHRADDFSNRQAHRGLDLRPDDGRLKSALVFRAYEVEIGPQRIDDSSAPGSGRCPHRTLSSPATIPARRLSRRRTGQVGPLVGDEICRSVKGDDQGHPPSVCRLSPPPPRALVPNMAGMSNLRHRRHELRPLALASGRNFASIWPEVS